MKRLNVENKKHECLISYMVIFSRRRFVLWPLRQLPPNHPFVLHCFSLSLWASRFFVSIRFDSCVSSFEFPFSFFHFILRLLICLAVLFRLCLIAKIPDSNIEYTHICVCYCILHWILPTMTFTYRKQNKH